MTIILSQKKKKNVWIRTRYLLLDELYVSVQIGRLKVLTIRMALKD